MWHMSYEKKIYYHSPYYFFFESNFATRFPNSNSGRDESPNDTGTLTYY